MADDRPKAPLTPEQEAALDLARQAITGEARSTMIEVGGERYEVPCVVARLVIEDGKVDAKMRPVSPVFKVPRG